MEEFMKVITEMVVKMMAVKSDSLLRCDDHRRIANALEIIAMIMFYEKAQGIEGIKDDNQAEDRK